MPGRGEQSEAARVSLVGEGGEFCSESEAGAITTKDTSQVLAWKPPLVPTRGCSVLCVTAARRNSCGNHTASKALDLPGFLICKHRQRCEETTVQC